MKSIIILLTLISTTAFGNNDNFSQYITCGDGTYSITLEVDKIESLPAKTEYKVYKDSKLVKEGSFAKTLQAYEGSFLNAFLWTFEDQKDESLIGVATQDIKALEGGIWSGKADVFILTDEGAFDGSSIDCEIEISKERD